MKQQLLNDITGKLTALGISFTEGNGSDFTISSEFLSAGWSTGSKKISYEASIFADEADGTVYMYEKTTEIGQGISFGGDFETSFQSGKTLFRKVKSIQYGPEGKVYELELDLGAIPKAVKETAVQYGWKFKTVLRREKAQYPAGYAPSVPPVTVQQPQITSTAAFCTACGATLQCGAAYCAACGAPNSGLKNRADKTVGCRTAGSEKHH